MDNIKIQHIDQALWFKSIEHYPKTVGQIRLLISIVDKMGIFNHLDLASTSQMESRKLNVIYAILRISNKLFNTYLDCVIKNIFRPCFQKIFVSTVSYAPCSGLFFDQLIQDLDHFLCILFKKYYPCLDHNKVKTKLITYLRATFRRIFYRNVMRKLSYQINEEFFIKHDPILTEIVSGIMEYNSQILQKPYDVMRSHLDKIFHPKCTISTTTEIYLLLEKHTNLTELFKENCLEIDIYSEQKLDDELESSNNSFLWDNSLSSSHDKMEEPIMRREKCLEHSKI